MLDGLFNTLRLGENSGFINPNACYNCLVKTQLAVFKNKKIMGVMFIALILLAVAYLLWNRNAGGYEIAEVPRNFRLHNYPGESLLDLASYPPVNESNKVLFEDHTYELTLSFDKPYMSPTPGSTITGTVQWLEDGKPLMKRPAWAAKKPNQAFPVAVPHNDGEVINPYRRGLTSQSNKSGIEAADGAEVLYVRLLPVSMQPITGGTLTVDGKTQQSDKNSDTQVMNLRRQPGLYSQAYSDSNLSGSSGTGEVARTAPAFLEFVDGKASFTYQFDGSRVLPFVQFRIDSNWIRDDRDVLAVSRAVFFEDQVGRVSARAIKTEDKSSIYYEVESSQKNLREGQSDSVNFKIEAKDSVTNRTWDEESQRVRVSVRPATNIFQLTRVEKGQNSVSPTSENPMMEYLQLLSYPKFTGKTEATTYGRFGRVLEGKLVTNRQNSGNSNPRLSDFTQVLRASLSEWLESKGIQVDDLTIDQNINGLTNGNPDALEALRIVLVAKIKSLVDTSEAGGNDSGINSIVPPFLQEKEAFLDFYQDWKEGGVVTANPSGDVRYIEVDLVNGRAEVEFLYNGKVGNQPLLTLEVQAIPARQYPLGNLTGLGEATRNLVMQLAATGSGAGLYGEWLPLEHPILGTHSIYQLEIK